MRTTNRRSVVWVALACAALPVLLAGCGDSGFRPLYASSSLTGGNVNEKLAQIEIAPIPGRVGQRLRNELLFQKTGGGDSAPAVYRLEIIIRESITATLVQIDGDSSGSVYNLDASFRLISLDSKKVVLQGTSYGRQPFERFDSVYANVRARQDAENRLARTVGDELKGRLAAFLSSNAA